MRSSPLIGTALAVATGRSRARPAPRPTELNFGIIATEASTNLKTVWEPFLAAMAKGTGFKINGFYASDYAGVIEAMRFKKVQVAWFGNKSAMEAVNRSNGEIFAQSVDADGNPGYWSHLIVHKDLPLKSLDDVLKCDKSLDFGIGDPNSTSGFLVPTTLHLRGQEHRSEAVLQDGAQRLARGERHGGRQQAGHASPPTTAKTCAASKRPRRKPRKNIRVIWTSPLIPSDPLVWRKDLRAGRQDEALHLGHELRPHRYAGRNRRRAQGAGRSAMGAVQSVERRPTAADPHPRGQQVDHEDQGRRQDVGRREGREDRRARGRDQVIEEQADKAEKSAFAKKQALFIEADKAGKQDELKKMIADFAPMPPSARSTELTIESAGPSWSGALPYHHDRHRPLPHPAGVPRRQPSHAVPQHPLARRMRAWLGWLLLFALLAWSWHPAEMFRVSALFTDWRNMAEFGVGLPAARTSTTGTPISPTWW